VDPSCGCGKPNDDHGRPDQITCDGPRRAADVNGISPEETVDIVTSTIAVA
jgi:hypothetical protein